MRPLFHLSHEHTFLWTIGQFFSVTNEMFAYLCTIGACAGFLFFETDRNFAKLWPIETCVCFLISVRNGSFAFLRTIESVRPFICATDVRCTKMHEHQHIRSVRPPFKMCDGREFRRSLADRSMLPLFHLRNERKIRMCLASRSFRRWPVEHTSALHLRH